MLMMLLIALFSCADQPSQKASALSQQYGNDTTCVWTKLLDSAAWKKSYNFQMFNIHDTLWVFHPDGTWFSSDGISWTRSPLPNAICNLAFLDYVLFKDAVYGLGHFEGNIEQFTFRPVIYKTTDFRHWDTLSTSSNLPNRFFHHPFVFDNKVWIIGGEDSHTQYADVWSSEDAVHWTRKKDHLPFGKRIHSQIVARHDTLFLLNNDVWVSTNALDWKKLTGEIMPGEDVFGYAPEMMNNKFWLLGCNRNGRFSSQVLVSEDGIHWLGHDAPWSPRGGIASTLRNGKIYITGGKYGGLPNEPEFKYSNDVWVMSPPAIRSNASQ